MSSSINRRLWMRNTLLSAGVGACELQVLSRLQAAQVGVPRTGSINRFPRMVHEAFVAEVRGIMRQRRRRLDGLKTKADAQAYVDEVRAKIDRCFGPWPERTPLNPRVTGIVEREAYRIEKVVFESRPQFFVTANLYVPKGLKGRAPGVVGSCGHSTNGKAGEAYQSFAQGLSRQGYVVLVFDPIGQGERLQHPHADDHNQSHVGIGVGEHLMVGNQQFLVDEFFGSWRAWDGMRALDYLLSRDEVDPNHVGITGNSGGGTMTTWLCGVERRWTMGAPSCFVTGFLRNLENELPADTEQCPPRVLAEGLDHGDFLIAMAPRPVIMMGQEGDYFDVRGLTDTYHQVRRVYELLGAQDAAAMFIGAHDHGYHQDAREAMYAHFNRATGRGDGPVKEPSLTMESDETLRCTQSGQVNEFKSRPVYSFTHEIADRLMKTRKPLQGDELRQAIRTTVAPQREKPKTEEPPHYRILRSRSVREYPRRYAGTYLYEVAPGVELPIYRLYDAPHYSRIPRDCKPAILYVSHDSCDAELRTESVIREAMEAAPDAAIYAVDLRGIGETRPNTCNDNSYHTPYGCDYFYAAYGIMLGRSYAARRVEDVEAVVNFLHDVGGHASIHIVARGYGAISAALASVASDNVTQVTLRHALKSYGAVASAEVYKWPLSSFLPGVLQKFDLPDVYRELKATKRLRLIDVAGAEGPAA